MKEEPSAFEQKLDAIIKRMDRLGDRVETIERKSPWDGQTSNTGRNPNFRKTKTRTLERLGLTKILGPHSRKIILKPQLLMNHLKMLKSILWDSTMNNKFS